MSQQPHIVPMMGGLDLESPMIAAVEGSVIGGENYEGCALGYKRWQGYERFDGRPAPSAATYHVLRFDAGSTEIAADDVIEGGTSGHTATVLIDAVVESGSWAGGDAAGYLVIAEATGSFSDNEAIEVSAAQVATVDGTALERGAPSVALDATWYALARAARRTSIAAVPGSGPVRGVFELGDDVYAIRDNVGGTAGVLHKATTGGWVAQDLGRRISFVSGGTYEIAEGDTIEGATSGATATVERLFLTGGSWGAGDAAGWVVLSGQTGTFVAENLDVGANLNVAAVGGNSFANALEAGGRYETIEHAFIPGQARAYAASGVGRAFEWDGLVFAEINTGLAPSVDKPTHVAHFAGHLFLQYEDGTVQHSGVADPIDFRTSAGAGEIQIGDEGRGLIETDSALVVMSKSRSDFITGSDATDFARSTINGEAGCEEWTATLTDRVLFIGDHQLRDLASSDTRGGWRQGALAPQIERLFTAYRSAGATSQAVVRARGSDIVRWFWSDGSAISLYLGRKSPEPMRLVLPFTAWCSSDRRRQFIGADDGYVYEIDRDQTNDGEAVDAVVRLAPIWVQRAMTEKRWHGIELHISGGARSTIRMLADFDLADPSQPASIGEDFTPRGQGGFWDSFTWDVFYWDARVEGLATGDVSGIGSSMTVAIRTQDADEPPHTLAALKVWWSPRGRTRRRV